jgi:YbgC/YbaW family acyl-CoA thioester hydrolase
MPAFCHTMPVRFADIDHAGIVYYPRYFDYFHVAMEEFFRARLGPRGYAELLDRDRIGFPAVSTQCEFKAPLRFGDTIDVEMSVIRLGTRSVTFCFRVYRTPGHDQPGGRVDDRGRGEETRVLAAEGRTTCAFVDLSVFRALAPPERLRQLLEPLVEDPA